MKIANEDVVTIHFTLKNTGGEVIESSKEGQPLAYMHGMGQMIPGFERALAGKIKGDSLDFKLSPEDGYGERDEDAIQIVSKEELSSIPNLEVGLEIEGQTSDGPIVFVVSEIREDEVVLDANHPLAGETLHFMVEVVDVRKATEEELEHGHVHGPGGHHHH